MKDRPVTLLRAEDIRILRAEGAQARKDGKHHFDCPYNELLQRYHWERGYEDEMDEDARFDADREGWKAFEAAPAKNPNEGTW